jgi:hypothetical protein
MGPDWGPSQTGSSPRDGIGPLAGRSPAGTHPAQKQRRNLRRLAISYQLAEIGRHFKILLRAVLQIRICINLPIWIRPISVKYLGFIRLTSCDFLEINLRWYEYRANASTNTSDDNLAFVLHTAWPDLEPYRSEIHIRIHVKMDPDPQHCKRGYRIQDTLLLHCKRLI